MRRRAVHLIAATAAAIAVAVMWAITRALIATHGAAAISALFALIALAVLTLVAAYRCVQRRPANGPSLALLVVAAALLVAVATTTGLVTVPADPFGLDAP